MNWRYEWRSKREIDGFIGSALWRLLLLAFSPWRFH
jgi:hypothetical protein